jgi:hypothetical protein
MPRPYEKEGFIAQKSCDGEECLTPRTSFGMTDSSFWGMTQELAGMPALPGWTSGPLRLMGLLGGYPFVNAFFQEIHWEGACA